MSCPTGLTDVWSRLTVALSRVGGPSDRVTVHDDPAPDWPNVDQWVDNPDADGEFDYRHLFTVPARKAQAATASRRLDLTEYVFDVVVLERYDGPEPTPPKDWVRARIDWVEREVYDRFGDARADPYPVEDCFPQAVDWADVYDVGLLREQKLFQSLVTLTLRRLEG